MKHNKMISAFAIFISMFKSTARDLSDEKISFQIILLVPGLKFHLVNKFPDKHPDDGSMIIERSVMDSRPSSRISKDHTSTVWN